MEGNSSRMERNMGGLFLVQKFYNSTYLAQREMWYNDGMLAGFSDATTYPHHVGSLEIPHAHRWTVETFQVITGQILVGILTPEGAIRWIYLDRERDPLSVYQGVFHAVYHITPCRLQVCKEGMVIEERPPQSLEELLSLYDRDRIPGNHLMTPFTHALFS